MKQQEKYVGFSPSSAFFTSSVITWDGSSAFIFSSLSAFFTSSVITWDVLLRYKQEKMEFGSASPMLTILSTLAMLNLFCFVGLVKELIITREVGLTYAFETMALQILLCWFLETIELVVSQSATDESEVSPNDVVGKVLGKEHSGRVRCLGLGAIPSKVFRQTRRRFGGINSSSCDNGSCSSKCEEKYNQIVNAHNQSQEKYNQIVNAHNQSQENYAQMMTAHLQMMNAFKTYMIMKEGTMPEQFAGIFVSPPPAAGFGRNEKMTRKGTRRGAGNEHKNGESGDQSLAMGPRKAVDPTSLEWQEQYEDLAAQQLDLGARSACDPRSEKRRLHHQSRDNSSSSKNRDNVQTGQGILGPNPYHVANTRSHNLLFPRFNGENLKNWLYRIEQYFAVDNTTANQKRGYNDPMLELKQLKQTGSVKEFQFAFARLLAQCDLTVSQAISCFLGGLKEELVNSVKMHEPQTLSKTYRLARLAEATLAANARALRSHTASVTSSHLKKSTYEPPAFKHNPTPSSSTPRLALPPPPTVNVARNRRTISPAEMQARRAQGLWYICDNKYTAGHKCNLPKQMFVMEVETVEEECDETKQQQSEEGLPKEEWTAGGSDTPMISLCALDGLQGAQTIHVTGYSEKRPIQILLDGGSTHNFIDEGAAKRLGCQIYPTKVNQVSLGNNTLETTSGVVKGFEWMLQGTTFSSDLLVFTVVKYDLVLGALWMKTLGPITMDYSELTMAFNYQGKHHLLKGVSEDCKVSSPKSLNRLKGADVQFFMLQVRESDPGSITTIQCQALYVPTADRTALIDQLLHQYHMIFAEPTSLPPQRGAFDHRITLQPGSKPVNVRPYRYSSIKKDIIEQLVNEMLQQGVIQYSNSPFSSPVVLVGKKDGSWRLCVDYRELNQCTVKDKFPIPLIDDLLDELVGAIIFCKIDLRSGYHQIRMLPEDVAKTAFKTHSGHYEYLVMPFGLTNAPSTFQCLMNHLFQKFLRKFVLVFFDDILIYSNNLHDHVGHLKQVFATMVSHNLLAKKSKCAFGVARVEYLGHFITADGVSTDPRKIEAVQQWPIPRTVKQLRVFLGLAGYYRKFIKGYGIISRPLTNLLRKDGFVWNAKAAESFAALKVALTSAPVLALPNYAIPFVVETDACGTGIGAVLMQHDHPIAFISKGLAPRHMALSVYEKELLALVFAVTKWSHYLLGHHFIVKTDQKALKYLLEQKLHTDLHIRWLAKLLPFDFEIQYKKGKENVAADSLSRVTGAELMSLMVSSVQTDLCKEIHNSWVQDPELSQLINSLQASPKKHFTGINNQLRRKGKLMVGNDMELRTKLLQLWHSSTSGGHSGVDATTRKVMAYFYWKGIRNDVLNFVRNCSACQRNKYDTSASAGLLQPLPLPIVPWTDINMDFIEGLPTSKGKSVIWVIVDRLTKYGHFIALAHPYTAQSLVPIFLDHIFKLHGFPATITSDRDPIFISSFWKEFLSAQGVHLHTSTAYHPQTDGETEVLNRCLETYLRCFCSDSPADWCAFLPLAEWWYNSSHHSVIQTSPFELLYGYPPPLHLPYLPGDSPSTDIDSIFLLRDFKLQLAKHHLVRAQQRMQDQANAHRTDRQFTVGDWFL
ncbi:PREDICTED: uncharacterized protein LOC109220546 [Nicotiana attenuata]|uniref:uncharacterized protein LOC109220546 n=1 Tax=Nicotiana attenuata TaxID=49451 RepID=UPI0009059735|nr:PREDICTED: uncharacterized protein LOC109220546 [Nicotiana attenuata]